VPARLSRRTAFRVAASATTVALAGCVGSDATSTTASTTDTSTTATTTTPTPVPCSTTTPDHDVPVPDEPDPLDEGAAVDAAVRFEEAYQRADKEARYDLVSYSASLAGTEVERLPNGYRVRVRLRVNYSSSGDESGSAVTASGGYWHEYVVTDRRFERDGTTLACW
jgi:hypothetical protein